MLKGDLSVTALTQVLIDLAAGAATGCVHLSDPAGETAKVYLRAGAVYAVIAPGRRPQLGARLVSSGALGPEALADALEAQRTELQGWRLGELLVHLGYVDQPVVEDFVNEQVRESLSDLLPWRSGTWRFRVNERTREDVAPPASVESLLSTITSRRSHYDAMADTLHGPDAVPVLSTAGTSSDEMEIDPDAWSLLCKVDGTRTVVELARECGFTLYEAAQVVFGLVGAGLLEIAETPVEAEQPEVYEPSAEERAELVPGDLAARLVSALVGAPATGHDTFALREDEHGDSEAAQRDEPVRQLEQPAGELEVNDSLSRVSQALASLMGPTTTDELFAPLTPRPVAAAEPVDPRAAERARRESVRRSRDAEELATAQAELEAARAAEQERRDDLLPVGHVADVVDLHEVREAARLEEQERAGRVAAETAEAERVAAEQAETERRDAERLADEQAEAERLEAERIDFERVAAEQAAAERAAAEQAETERLDAERIENERIAAEQAEAERAAAERAETERLDAERLENERIAAEQAETERAAAEQAETERLAAEQAEAERLAAEQAAAEQAETERLAAEQAEAERLEAERAAAEQAETERLEAERAAAEQAEAERAAAEQAENERLDAERLENERIAAEQAEAERIAAEHAEAERAAAEQAETERLAAEQAENEWLDAEKAEAERVERERIAAEQAENERAAAEQAEAERIAAEQAERERVELERLAAERSHAERFAAEQAARAELAEATRWQDERAEEAAAQAAAAQAAPASQFADLFEDDLQVPAVDREAQAAAFAELSAAASMDFAPPPPAATVVEATPDDDRYDDRYDDEPMPTYASHDTDTASLMRELSSLGLDDDAPSAPPPRPPAPRPISALPAKKKKGLFGRG